MKKFNVLDWIVAILLVIGGLNWGFVGFFGIDVIGSIFGDMSGFTRFIYALVGLSAIYAFFMPSRMGSEKMVPGEPMHRAT